MTLKIEKPDDWGEDDLTSYLQTAFVNRLATFEKKKKLFGQLKRIDRCFLDIADNWLNPSSIAFNSPFLFMRCHASFRASCEHALATQFTDIFPQLRATLEYAAYALYIEKNPDAEVIWIKRHDSKESLKKVRNEFYFRRLVEVIAKYNGYIGDIYESLYEATIAYGAHPNERSITANLVITESDQDTRYDQTYMHNDESIITVGLLFTIQAGLCSLEILQEIFPERFELKGVRSKILNLRREVKYPIPPGGKTILD